MPRRPSRRSRRSPVYAILFLIALVLGMIGVRLSPELAGWLPPELRRLLVSQPQKPERSAPRPPPADVALADLPRTASTFENTKTLLYGTVYRDHRKTFYCDCDYDERRQVDLASCDLEALQDRPRAQRVEAEHVFPASQFGNFRPCWRDPQQFPACVSNGQPLSGRQCCEAVDPVFRAAHNDLMNLFPAVGEINGQRRDYNWGMVPGTKHIGQCAIEIDPDIRRVEPPDRVKGDVARVMFYMEDTYKFRLSDQDRQLFTAWSRQDPPDQWEIDRSRRISGLQGKGNRFIEDYRAIFGKAVVVPKAVLVPSPTASTPATQSAAPAPATSPATSPWQCGTKTTCGQMTSCEEAKFYLTQCGVRSLDRDGDGIPCASLCR
jgi:deoxyribonuclease-1